MQGPQWYAPPGAPEPAPSAYGDDADVMLEPGGFGIRAGAHVIDVIATTIAGAVAGAIGGFSVALLGAAGVIGPGWETRIGKQTIGTFAFGFLGSLLYHTVAEALGGATIGKAICGLRVLTEDRRPCTLVKALVRNLAYYLDSLFFGAVAWSSMSSSPTKQRHGDKWAGTIVVRSRGMPAAMKQNPAGGIALGIALYGVVQVVATVVKVI
ncbi:MAG: RDD family protein [Labilithrix sp.]|nr:RDD family protein [Labilithrix sp.]MBX3222921.1 RDD family protein [Labilithrix sp.]